MNAMPDFFEELTMKIPATGKKQNVVAQLRKKVDIVR
jgi:hypothetical protein